MSTALDRGEHGRAAWIHYGCRCPVCHRDLLEYSRVRLAAQIVMRGGEPAGKHPPSLVRAHVDKLLAAGWSQRAIAAAAGVSDATVCRIAKRTTKHVSRITARSILAVEP